MAEPVEAVLERKRRELGDEAFVGRYTRWRANPKFKDDPALHAAEERHLKKSAERQAANRLQTSPDEDLRLFLSGSKAQLERRRRAETVQQRAMKSLK